MRIAALIGQSASGKSTIGQALFERLGPGRKFSGWIFGTLHDKYKVAVLGSYEPQFKDFPGADVINPRALPHEAGAWLRKFYWTHPDWNVFFEGNMITSPAFLTYFIPVPVSDLRIYISLCSDKERTRRHRIRNSGKESHLLDIERARDRQIEYIKRLFPISYRELINEQKQHPRENAKIIRGFLTENP